MKNRIIVFSIKKTSGQSTDGIDNVNFSVFSHTKRVKFVQFSSQFFNRLLAMLKLQPDYLWGMGTVKDLPWLIFKPKKTKYIINWHTVLWKNKGAWKVRTPWWLRKFLFNRAHKIITVSNFSALNIRKYFPDKSVGAVLNGIDSELFSPNKKDEEYLKKKYRLDFSKPLVLFVGALHPRKRPETFIDLAKRYKRANFVLVGRKVVEYNTSGLLWIPQMPREDVAVLMASSDLFVFPSLNEPCAAVIQEAMASGLPVILSNHGGNKEFITHGQEGYLVNVGSDEKKEFLLCIQKALLDKKILGGRARKKAVRDFSWQNVARRYEDYLFSA